MGSATSASGVPSGRSKKRRTRRRNSTTSAPSKALSSDSIGTRCRTLPKSATGGAPTRWDGLSGADQFGKARLDRLVAPAQGVVLGVRDLRRVALVVEAVVAGDLGGERRQLPGRLLARELLDRNRLGCGHARQADCGDQAFGGGARRLGDRRPGQHAGDLLAPLGSPQRLRRDRRAAAADGLLDPKMVVGAGGDLRRMGHDQHLDRLAEACQALADRIGGGAADPGVDLVEHQACGSSRPRRARP